MSEPIKVDGLAEFSRNLRKLDSELPKQLRVTLNDVAQLVVDEAKPKVPRRSGKAANSIKARSTRTQARVAAGGRKVPYYAWLDFGGRVGRKHAVKRPFLKRGRYLYPAYESLRDSGKFQRTLQEALEQLVIRVGLGD